jgi:hypothetical protein
VVWCGAAASKRFPCISLFTHTCLLAQSYSVRPLCDSKPKLQHTSLKAQQTLACTTPRFFTSSQQLSTQPTPIHPSMQNQPAPLPQQDATHPSATSQNLDQ